MRSDIGIEIEAPAALVFSLARGVERWERLLPHYARSRVVARAADGATVVEFVARRPLIPVLGLGLPVAWRARTWSEPSSLRLRFVHVAGVTRGMYVTWRIESVGGDGADRTRVTIEHDFSPRVPGLAGFVDRAFTRAIAGRTLATFKALAEAIAAEPMRAAGELPIATAATADPRGPGVRKAAAVQEMPAIAEKTTVEETPAVEEAPAAKDAPSVRETPARTDAFSAGPASGRSGPAKAPR